MNAAITHTRDSWDGMNFRDGIPFISPPPHPPRWKNVVLLYIKIALWKCLVAWMGIQSGPAILSRLHFARAILMMRLIYLAIRSFFASHPTRLIKKKSVHVSNSNFSKNRVNFVKRYIFFLRKVLILTNWILIFRFNILEENIIIIVQVENSKRFYFVHIYQYIFIVQACSVLRAMAERVERITCREDFWMEILHGKRERRSFFCPRELADRVLSRGKQLIRSFRRRLIHSTLLSSLLWPPASILHHQAEKGDGTREEEERRLSDVRKQSVGEAEFREWTSSQRETVDGRSFILPPFVHVASASSSRTLFITFPFVLWIFFSRACLRFDSPSPLHPPDSQIARRGNFGRYFSGIERSPSIDPPFSLPATANHHHRCF